MKRNHPHCLRRGADFLVAAVLLYGCAVEPADPLVGTWLLESVAATSPDGSVNNAPYGEAPTGYLTYTAEDRMQVILAFSGRNRLSGDWRSSPATERAAAFATSLSYAGRYSVTDDRVTHYVEVSSDPNRVGTSIERTFRLKSDQLVLTTPPTSVGGTLREFALTWRRASAAARGAP